MFSSIFSRSSRSISSSSASPMGSRSVVVNFWLTAAIVNERLTPMDTLEDLIAEVEEQAASDAPLDLVSAAMGTKADLDDLGDGLIDVFVARARAAGCSWSEIGTAMGVTKQAAQQRHHNGRPHRDRS